ncbi:MAG: hypothetical protein ACKOPG_09450 [Novosphingobium sp.]
MIELGDKVLRRLREVHFNRVARGILATPPVCVASDGLVIFSMIGTKVLLPYLVAAKSFQAALGRGRFVILDDGTLTASDRDILARHLGDPAILPIAAVDTGACPKGGCWERLLTLFELRRDDYVIQLDSDTVTLGTLPEVIAAIEARRDFTLRGEAQSAWAPASRFSRDPATLPPNFHVQGAIEAVMGEACSQVPGLTHYVRGCAGFAGFAPGGLGRETAEAFCRSASGLLGSQRWAQWGSEQVMSNLVVSNEGEPVLLPYDRYLNFWNEPVGAEAAFVHFVGTYRFHRGAYAAAARQAIAALTAGLKVAA